MKKILLLSILIFISRLLNAQDIIVLKKDESEIKVKIISVNDTLIRYKLWQSTDTTTSSLKRVEVLSFLYAEQNAQNTSKFKTEILPVPGPSPGTVGVGVGFSWKLKTGGEYLDANLLEKYRGGETVDGYVVTNKNDTLRGLITLKNVALSQLEVMFTDANNKIITYSTDEVMAYSYNEVRYEKVKTKYKKEIINNRKAKNGHLFLHAEVEGPAKLFRFYTLQFPKNTYKNNPDLPYYFGKMKHYFLITNPSGKQLLTKGRTIKGCVNNLFYDNMQLMQSVRDKGVNAKNLPATVRSYNEWYGNKK